MEKLSAFSFRLYHTTIKVIESYVAVNQKFNDSKVFVIWHDRLGHPRSSMMRRIIEHSHGHPLKNQKILSPNEYSCVACSQGKLKVRPFFTKFIYESIVFLERIKGNIYRPIHPPYRPFRYFMILIDVSTRWSHVCLISTLNVTFARLLAQMIKLQAQFPNDLIKTIRLDNASEFSSQTFIDYYMSVEINIEHLVAHAHAQNGLVEFFIKRL